MNSWWNISWNHRLRHAHQTECEEQPSFPSPTSTPVPIKAPPKFTPVETFEQKAWRKFTQEPLVPIGCLCTVYFLVSGIKSFRDSDPVRSQKMMRLRVMSQLGTIVCFMAYAGWDRLDFRLAPMYQDAKKRAEEEKMQQQQQQQQQQRQPPPSQL